MDSPRIERQRKPPSAEKSHLSKSRSCGQSCDLLAVSLIVFLGYGHLARNQHVKIPLLVSIVHDNLVLGQNPFPPNFNSSSSASAMLRKARYSAGRNRLQLRLRDAKVSLIAYFRLLRMKGKARKERSRERQDQWQHLPCFLSRQ